MTFHRTLLLLTAVLATQVQAQADERYSTQGIELYSVAIPTSELTVEAAKKYNVERSPTRGLLTVTLVRKDKSLTKETLAGQVYAGAINLRNNLSSIPIREIRDGDAVYYLGEFQVSAPDTLRFLVNANVMGKVMKSEFAREFHGAQTVSVQQLHKAPNSH